MMNQSYILQEALRIEHRHKDGSWGEMVEDHEHTSVDHDPERQWRLGRIFRCTSCDESLTVVPGDEGAPAAET